MLSHEHFIHFFLFRGVQLKSINSKELFKIQTTTTNQQATITNQDAAGDY